MSNALRIPDHALPAWYRLADATQDGVPCEADPDLWQAVDGDQLHAAIEACRTCPALDACREYATTAREPVGVWGATTPSDRTQQKRGTTAA